MFRTFSAFLFGLAGAANAQDRLPITIAAEARQKAIRTLDVRFEIERIIETVTQPGQPPTTVARKSLNSRFVLDGDKLLLEYTEPVPNGNEITVRLAYDGTSLRQYHTPQPGAPARQNAAGKLKKTKEVGADLDDGLLPLMSAVCGVDPRFNTLPLHGKFWVPDKPLLRVFGPRLDGYKHRDGAASDLLRLWTDPSRDHAIALVQSESGGLRIEIEQQRHLDSGQWLPKKWRISSPSAMRYGLRIATTYTVTSMEVNRPIPADTFALTFPAGMPVVDMDTMESYVAADGGRLVPVQAPPTTFPVVKADPEPEPNGRTGLIVVIAVSVGLLAVLVVVRLRRHPTDPPPA